MISLETFEHPMLSENDERIPPIHHSYLYLKVVAVYSQIFLPI